MPPPLFKTLRRKPSNSNRILNTNFFFYLPYKRFLNLLCYLPFFILKLSPSVVPRPVRLAVFLPSIPALPIAISRVKPAPRPQKLARLSYKIARRTKFKRATRFTASASNAVEFSERIVARLPVVPTPMVSLEIGISVAPDADIPVIPAIFNI